VWETIATFIGKKEARMTVYCRQNDIIVKEVNGNLPILLTGEQQVGGGVARRAQSNGGWGGERGSSHRRQNEGENWEASFSVGSKKEKVLKVNQTMVKETGTGEGHTQQFIRGMSAARDRKSRRYLVGNLGGGKGGSGTKSLCREGLLGEFHTGLARNFRGSAGAGVFLAVCFLGNRGEHFQIRGSGQFLVAVVRLDKLFS